MALKDDALERLERIADEMERLGLDEYISYLRNKRRVLIVNFMAGVARGFGMAIGFTILGAIVIAFLQRLTVDGMTGFVADIIRMVQEKL